MKNLIYLPLILLLTSCITHNGFTKLPSDEEFVKPKSYLKNKYKDIALYEEGFRGFSPNWPMEKELVKHFGEPDKVIKNWKEPAIYVGTLLALSADPIVWGIMFALRPVPSKTYIYKKGNYCISAHVNYDAFNGYEDYMTYWEWIERKDKCF